MKPFDPRGSAEIIAMLVYDETFEYAVTLIQAAVETSYLRGVHDTYQHVANSAAKEAVEVTQLVRSVVDNLATIPSQEEYADGDIKDFGPAVAGPEAAR